jgi:L-tryptophan--pyruvate aminotransferase
MSYFSDVGNVCRFLEPGFGHEVRRLHRLALYMVRFYW